MQPLAASESPCRVACVPLVQGFLEFLERRPVQIIDTGDASAMTAFPRLGLARRLGPRILGMEWVRCGHWSEGGNGSFGKRRLNSTTSPSASASLPSLRKAVIRSIQADGG